MEKVLTRILEDIKSKNQGLFIPYIMAGDSINSLEDLFTTISYLEEQGVSAIEIGVPWSDPVADGPVIELAGQRSLSKGTNLEKILEKLKEKKTRVPLILMSYFNPIYQFGVERFINELKETSVKAIIVPDLPYEHHSLIGDDLKTTDISLINLISLTTDKERQKTILSQAEGFIYAVAVNGITGEGKTYSDSLNEHLKTLTEMSSIPVLTGFGVSSFEDVERFNRYSDGVIVGSKIVKELNEGKSEILKEFIYKSSHLKK